MARGREIVYIAPHDLKIIGLDTDHREEHPLFDERVFWPVDEHLVKNIGYYGIQQPVLVRREGGSYHVIDGRQRVRAARSAAVSSGEKGEHQLKVPCRLVQQNDKVVSGIMISTNELRKDDTILGKAMKAARLLDQLGSINEVATAFGRTVPSIRNWLKLAEADPTIHDAVDKGILTAASAIEISRYDREEQVEALERVMDRVAKATPEGQAVKPVSESVVKKDRQAQGHSSAAGTASPKAASSTALNKQSRAQAGVKRTWVRKALETTAGKALTEDERVWLKWIATGELPTKKDLIKNGMNGATAKGRIEAFVAGAAQEMK